MAYTYDSRVDEIVPITLLFLPRTGGLHHCEHVPVQGVRGGPLAAPGRCPDRLPQECRALELQSCGRVPGRFHGKAQQAPSNHRRYRRGWCVRGVRSRAAVIHDRPVQLSLMAYMRHGKQKVAYRDSLPCSN